MMFLLVLTEAKSILGKCFIIIVQPVEITRL